MPTAGSYDRASYNRFVSEPRKSARNPIGRAFRILSWMAGREDGPFGVREIAKGVGMSPSTVHRLLGLLEDERLIRQTDDTGRYGLGVEFLRLSWQASSLYSLREDALPAMRTLVEEAGETAALGLYDPVRGQTCIIAIVESDAPVRYVPSLYEWRNLHTGASGRAVLAFLPEADRTEILTRAPLAPATERTLTDPAELEEVLAIVRAQGYALSVEERRVGGVGLAAPIFAPGGSVVAEVGIAVPAQRYTSDQDARLAASVLRCAATITAAIGGTPA
jgi:IclR family transcriptional regulator, acetate operon repressor